MKQLSEDGCVELKVDHPLSDRGYTAIVSHLDAFSSERSLPF